jgi:DNA mismatch endonuclease (patch repair protein)
MLVAFLELKPTMADVFSKSKRSEVMASIRSRENKATEIAFMTLLRSHRITGWRRHLAISLLRSKDGLRRRSRQVKPDFVFKARRVAVFIDGCFWHGCPIHGSKPGTNKDFWLNKLTANRARDRFVDRALRQQKWTVLRFWEHQLRGRHRVMHLLRRRLAEPNAQSIEADTDRESNN